MYELPTTAELIRDHGDLTGRTCSNCGTATIYLVGDEAGAFLVCVHCDTTATSRVEAHLESSR